MSPVEEPPVVEAPRHRRHLVPPITCVLVLLVSAGLAVGGLTARSSAENSARAATEQLAAATSARDDMRLATSSATSAAAQNASDLAIATTFAQAVDSGAIYAVGIGDQLVACSQRQADAETAFDNALAVGDYTRANRAVGAYNAAVDDCNAAIDAYDAAVTNLFTPFATSTV